MGRGAAVRWRSKNQRGDDIVTAIILKFDAAKVTYEPSSIKNLFLQGVAELPDRTGSLMGFVSFCKHFCCVPGFHESKKAATTGYADKVFCTCHDSVYDPIVIKAYDLVRVVDEGKE